MINVRILSMAIRTFFMANLDYAAAGGRLAVGSGSSVVLCVSSGHWPTVMAASCAVVGVLLDVGLASRKAKMF